MDKHFYRGIVLFASHITLHPYRFAWR